MGCQHRSMDETTPPMPSYTCILPWVHAGPVDFSISFYDCISTQPHQYFGHSDSRAEQCQFEGGGCFTCTSWISFRRMGRVHDRGCSFSAIWQPGIGVSVRRYWAVCIFCHAASSRCSFVSASSRCSFLNGFSLYRTGTVNGVVVACALPREALVVGGQCVQLARRTSPRSFQAAHRTAAVEESPRTSEVRGYCTKATTSSSV